VTTGQQCRKDGETASQKLMKGEVDDPKDFYSSFFILSAHHAREAKIDRPLNAIKKTAPTAAARIRSTSKVCIFKHLLSVSALPYGQPIYRPPSSVEKSLPPNVEMNSRRPMSIVSDRARWAIAPRAVGARRHRSIYCKYPLAEVRRAYSAMSEQNCSLWIGVGYAADL
jgi:hypothetical protein